MKNNDIRLCGDLVLREKCEEVKDISSDILSTLDSMIEIMKSQDGVGLAAPQVGILKRFVVMMNPDTKQIYKMINPVIKSKSDETVSMEEGCLSILNSKDIPVFSNVTRPADIEVEWMDENGIKKSSTLTGLISRVAQHEIDHLDGVLFIDYLSPVKREMLMRKVKRKHS